MPETTVDLLRTILPLLIPIVVLEFALLVIALIDVIRRPRVRFDNKLVWILIILFVNLFGPLAYLIFGRQED